jgi:hypothetical protein
VFIKKLRPSERAPANVDHICIVKMPGGRMTWSGLVNVAGAVVRSAGGAMFTTIAEAETDAIAWARRQGTSQLLIDVSGVWLLADHAYPVSGPQPMTS